MTEDVTLRAATPADVDAIVAVWEAGWRETHRDHVPAALLQHRDTANFTLHAHERVDSAIVAIVWGALAGFVMVHDDEIDQLYVDPRFRGTPIASRLLKAGEARIATAHARARLAVLEVNARARRFYERCGWADAGPYVHQAWAGTETVGVHVRRYEKELGK